MHDEELEATFREGLKTAMDTLEHVTTFFRAASAASVFGDYKTAFVNYQAAVRILETFVTLEQKRRKGAEEGEASA